MFYRISHHARQKMRLRGISEAEVDAVMNAPGQIIPETGGKKAYQSQLSSGGRTVLLRVIVADQIIPVVVVTAYSTTQISKYWT